MSRKSTSRRELEKERRRETILEAATQLFAERGLENVTFGDIAKATGLSRPLVYFYFPDRETLFLETVVRSEQELHSRFVTAVKPHLDGHEQIVAIGRAYVAFLRERPCCFSLITAHGARKVTEACHEHPLQAQVEEVHKATMELMTRTLARGVGEGVLRKDLGDLLQVAVCLWGFTHGIVQIISHKGEQMREHIGLDPAATLETAFELMTRAIKNPKTAK
ncbi:TetR/AcrR family transcriptional regulator [Congregicoccus parvus]|uniref:TetR/AcrR family transcriptional regulator n=1 Tax=Congregicoccus parvus TaxID=3081749 RepID=UPI003FA5FD8F